MDPQLLIALAFFVGALTFLVKLCAPEIAALIRAQAAYIHARAEIERAKYLDQIDALKKINAELTRQNGALWTDILELRRLLELES